MIEATRLRPACALRGWIEAIAGGLIPRYVRCETNV